MAKALHLSLGTARGSGWYMVIRAPLIPRHCWQGIAHGPLPATHGITQSSAQVVAGICKESILLSQL